MYPFSPSTYVNMWIETFSLDNLYDAFEQVKRAAHVKTRYYRYETLLDRNLRALHNKLMSGHYHPAAFNVFCYYDHSRGKERRIEAPFVNDAIVERCIYDYLFPYFDKVFINTSYCGRPEKGTKAATEQVHKWMQSSPSDSWYVQMDIHKYYDSIQPAILKQQLLKYLPEESYVDLMLSYTHRDDPKFKFCGCGIGHLLSQLFGSLYLHEFDTYVQYALGYFQYARYADDFIVVGVSKLQVTQLRDQMRAYLKNRLGLETSNVQLNYLTNGVNFVGRLMRPNRQFRVRHNVIKQLRNAIKHGDRAAIISYLGMGVSTTSYEYMLRLIPEHLAMRLPKRFKNDFLLYRNHYRRS